MPRYAAQIGSTLTGLRRSHAADLGNVGLHLRERFAAEFLHLSDDHKSLESPTEYEVEISPGLQELYRQASKQARTTK